MEGPVEKPHDDASALHVGISCVQTKTWLDYQAGGSPLKVYWSDGDKINVNGISSLSLSVEDGTKTSLADFNNSATDGAGKGGYITCCGPNDEPLWLLG